MTLDDWLALPEGAEIAIPQWPGAPVQFCRHVQIIGSPLPDGSRFVRGRGEGWYDSATAEGFRDDYALWSERGPEVEAAQARVEELRGRKLRLAEQIAACFEGPGFRGAVQIGFGGEVVTVGQDETEDRPLGEISISFDYESADAVLRRLGVVIP